MANDNNNSHIIIYAIHKKTWVINKFYYYYVLLHIQKIMKTNIKIIFIEKNNLNNFQEIKNQQI